VTETALMVSARLVCEQRAHLPRQRDQRAGFQALHPGEDLERLFPAGNGVHVDHLTAHHAARAGGNRQPFHQLAAHQSIAMGFGRHHDFKGQRLQRIASQHGGRLVERLVDRGLAPAEIIVVHARQVVVDQ
jgi:hypothetical protein